MSKLEKLSWKALTPGSEPWGARISAGMSGTVLMSLPKTADVFVNCEPVSCIPSPESPAKRMVTRSTSRVCWSASSLVSVVTSLSTLRSRQCLIRPGREVENLPRECFGEEMHHVNGPEYRSGPAVAGDDRDVLGTVRNHDLDGARNRLA